MLGLKVDCGGGGGMPKGGEAFLGRVAGHSAGSPWVGEGHQKH